MKKIVIILFLLWNITIQAKEVNEYKFKKKPVQSELKHKQLLGPWDDLLSALEALTRLFRPVWGDYTESSMRANPWPKTMFPRSVNDDIQALVDSISAKVI